MIKDKIDYGKAIEKLLSWQQEYDAGHPTISDEEWDKIYFEVEEFEKRSGIVFSNSPTQKINYDVVSELKKVKHNHPMLSLAKTKDWGEFLNYFFDLDTSKDVCGMVKLDGLTCSLKYINGELVSAETRGNGEIGEDILHNAKVVSSIPKHINYKDELIVDGEIICTYEDFREFSNLYKNPRNFAAGSIRLLDAAECAKRKLKFIVWNVIKGFESNSFNHKLTCAKEEGFLVVPHVMSFDYDAKEFLQEQATKLGYPIDGLVGRFDDIAFGEGLGATGHHSRAAFAFKFYDEEYDTTLRDIEWTMGRTGVLTPIACFDTVDIEGSSVSKASLHNLSVLNQVLGTPYSGQKIKVFKANLIIPQVSSGEKLDLSKGVDPSWKILDEPTHCPICGKETTVKNNDGILTLWCNNPNCEGKLINRLDHFCGKKGFEIKGLSKATLEKLIEWNWVSTFDSIFWLKEHRREWIKKDGFGEKSVDKILNAIEASKATQLWRVISAAGIPQIGVEAAKALSKHFNTWEDFRAAIETKFDFTQFKDFGDVTAEALLTFNFAEIDRVMLEDITYDIAKEETSNSLEGLTFVITGKVHIFKNRDEVKAKIESFGGKVAGSVTSKTSYLINNDASSATAKNKKAKELGIPIITEEDFLNLIK